MVMGEKSHGPLHIETDPRDFLQEALEELIDSLNYLEIAMIQGRLPFCQWYETENFISAVIRALKVKKPVQVAKLGF